MYIDMESLVTLILFTYCFTHFICLYCILVNTILFYCCCIYIILESPLHCWRWDWGFVEDLWRRLFLKLDTNVLLLSCAPGPPTPLSILVRASLRCSVKGVVHSVVWDLQFLGNFLHEIAFISRNKNRLTSFRRMIFVWPFWACNRTHKCWCSRFSASLKKASFIASLINTTVFSCANIIAKGFSNEQLAF